MRYDPILARGLARDIETRWRERRVEGVVFDPARRAVELSFETGDALLALLHREAGLLLATEPALGKPTERFRLLFLGAAVAIADERIIALSLVDAEGLERQRLIYELQTNRWNALLADVHEEQEEQEETPPRIRHLLWRTSAGGRVLRPGGPYHPPTSERAGVADPVSPEDWRAMLGAIPPSERRATALESVAWISAINADHILGAAAAGPGEETLAEAYGRYRTVLVAGDAWLLGSGDRVQVYTSRLGASDARLVPGPLAGMAEAAEARGGIPALLELGADEAAGAGPETTELAAALRRRRKRLRKRAAALRRQLEGGADPAELRTIGSLILARLREIPRGASRIELEDFDGTARTIELDPKIDAAANADAFFDRAGRRERAIEQLPPQIEAAEGALAELEAALSSLESSGPSDALWDLAGGQPAPAKGRRRPEPERLSYLRFRSSGGLEIRAGRGARDNDELTLHQSAPEDIWLHARQVKGSHVVLRWGRRNENPPQRDLVEAAIVAAVHSGARHSGTVAVDWTRRKYVRKPRKSPAGTVTIERATTLFVEPDEALVKKLRVDD